MKLKEFLFIFAACCLCYWVWHSLITETTTTTSYIPEPIVYYKSKLLVSYKDTKQDTFNINIYDKPNNISLTDGNLSYWNPTGETGGAVAGVTNLCSYVKSYKILSSEKDTVK